MVFVHEMTQDGGQRRIKVDAKYSAQAVRLVSGFPCIAFSTHSMSFL